MKLPDTVIVSPFRSNVPACRSKFPFTSTGFVTAVSVPVALFTVTFPNLELAFVPKFTVCAPVPSNATTPLPSK